MDCEGRQEQLSLLLDGEAAAADQPALFRHLGECADCRLFIDTLVRLRGAAARERARAADAADDIPLPLLRRAAARGLDRTFAGRWRPAAGWRLPVPAALVAAIVLLLGGALLGAKWAAVGHGAEGPAGRSSVVVVCSLPEVVVR